MITKDKKTNILYAVLLSLAISLCVWFLLKTFLAVLIFFVCLLILLNLEVGPKQKESTSGAVTQPVTKSSTISTSRKTKNKSTKSGSIATQGKDVFAWPSLGDFNFEIAEEADYQTTLNKLVNGQAKDEKFFRANLIPEDNNPDDDRSIRIEINDITAGHLRRDNARSFRRRLSAKNLKDKITRCQAIIVSNQKKKTQKKSYSVFLDIKLFT